MDQWHGRKVASGPVDGGSHASSSQYGGLDFGNRVVVTHMFYVCVKRSTTKCLGSHSPNSVVRKAPNDEMHFWRRSWHILPFHLPRDKGAL